MDGTRKEAAVESEANSTEQLQALHHQADVAVGALHLVLDDPCDVMTWCF